MPARLRQRVDALQVTTIDRYPNRRRTTVDSNQLIAIGMAVRAQEILRFDYQSPGAPEGEWLPPRKVEPHHLVTWGGRWYLIGWDLDRADWRTFRVDRITPKTPTGPRFTPRELPAADVSEYIARQFKTKDQYPCRGEAVLQLPADEVAPWSGQDTMVEEVTPTSCRVTMTAWSWVGLASRFAMFECDLELVGPPELIDAAHHIAARFQETSR